MKPAAHPSHTLWNPFSPLAALAVFKPLGTALRAGTRLLRNSLKAVRLHRSLTGTRLPGTSPTNRLEAGLMMSYI
jgi:hypothetical protein